MRVPEGDVMPDVLVRGLDAETVKRLKGVVPNGTAGRCKAK